MNLLKERKKLWKIPKVQIKIEATKTTEKTKKRKNKMK
jgi:hypothetical protein